VLVDVSEDGVGDEEGENLGPQDTGLVETGKKHSA
jgi:hypothetical protein